MIASPPLDWLCVADNLPLFLPDGDQICHRSLHADDVLALANFGICTRFAESA